jgi:hypothetical protein
MFVPTRGGQKRANEADDPVPFFLLAGRVTTQRANFSVPSIFLEPRFLTFLSSF